MAANAQVVESVKFFPGLLWLQVHLLTAQYKRCKPLRCQQQEICLGMGVLSTGLQRLWMPSFVCRRICSMWQRWWNTTRKRSRV